MVKNAYIVKLTLLLVSLLPDTKLYKLKTRILKLQGFDVDYSVRIVSSLKILGLPDLSIKKDTFIGHFCKIYGTGVVNIGSCVDIAPEVSLITGTHDINTDGSRVAGKGKCVDIFIGDNTWIGTGCVVLGGTTIGKNCMVAAGSVVKGDYPDFSFIGGNPAKCIKPINELFNVQ